MDGFDLIIWQLYSDGVGVDDLNDFTVEIFVTWGNNWCCVDVILPNTHLPFFCLPELNFNYSYYLQSSYDK